MKIYMMYILILIVTIFLISIIKDKSKAIRLTGILTISSSLLLIALVFIIKIIIDASITSINISNITDFLFMKTTKNSMILFILGLVELIISKYIIKKQKVIKN